MAYVRLCDAGSGKNVRRLRTKMGRLAHIAACMWPGEDNSDQKLPLDVAHRLDALFIIWPSYYSYNLLITRLSLETNYA